jgi:hypothetical protein
MASENKSHFTTKVFRHAVPSLSAITTPLAFQYSSADKSPDPPVISTCPLFSSVAAWPDRAFNMPGIGRKSLASNISALLVAVFEISMPPVNTTLSLAGLNRVAAWNMRGVSIAISGYTVSSQGSKIRDWL